MKHDSTRAIIWQKGTLQLLDQRELPHKLQYLDFDDASTVATAIRNMVVRGAPAIGIAAAYGVVLAATKRYSEDPNNWKKLIKQDIRQLADARPTAVNLFWGE